MKLVLIVEDSDSVAPLEIALAAAKMNTIVLSSGKEALKLLDSETPELSAVITDLHLPGADGFELVAAIRSHARYAKLPVIVVSGDNHPDNCRRVRELGAHAFFAKPYSPGEVRQALEDIFHAP